MIVVATGRELDFPAARVSSRSSVQVLGGVWVGRIYVNTGQFRFYSKREDKVMQYFVTVFTLAVAFVGSLQAQTRAERMEEVASSLMGPLDSAPTGWT